MIHNQNELGDLEQKAGDLKNIAFNVRNNAEHLRKEAARRHTRLMIIIALVGISILAYIIIPLVPTDDDDKAIEEFLAAQNMTASNST